MHERADVQANLRPERLVVGLEDHPLEPAEQALFDEQRGAAHGDVLVFVRVIVGAAQGACAPTTRPNTGKRTQQLMPSGLSSPFSSSVIGTSSVLTPTSEASRPAGISRLALHVRARKDAADHLRRQSDGLVVLKRIELVHSREEHRRVSRTRQESASLPKRVRAVLTASHAVGGSTISIARRFSQ